jgi:phosphoribosylformylglycinamidine cyclo-ligase
MLGPQNVKVGDRLYALPASGFHSNGYSLLRHWLKNSPVKGDRRVLEQLMLPTRIYHEIPELVDNLGTERFHALANITGGGISGNLPRVMPADTVCRIAAKALPVPGWMREFIEANGATVMSQEAVFNLGCGMIAAVAKDAGSAFEGAAKKAGLEVREIGEVRAGRGEATVQFT